jgi:hypothetical protein
VYRNPQRPPFPRKNIEDLRGGGSGFGEENTWKITA